MKQSVTFTMFREAFRNAGRADQFSHEGLEALFDYLEELEADTGEQIELDVIALCCDFWESSAEEVCHDFGLEPPDGESMEDIAREYLEGEGVLVAETEGSFIYQAH